MAQEKESNVISQFISKIRPHILALSSVASSFISVKSVFSDVPQHAVDKVIFFLFTYLGGLILFGCGMLLFFGIIEIFIDTARKQYGFSDSVEKFIMIIPPIIGMAVCFLPNFFEINVCENCKDNLSDYSAIIKTEEGTFCQTCGMEYMKENRILFIECDSCGEKIYQGDVFRLNNSNYCGVCYSYIEIDRVAESLYHDGYNDGYSDGFYVGSEH